MDLQIKKTQQAIIEEISKIDCANQLSEISNFLNKNLIRSKVELFLSNKGLDFTSNIDWLTDLILFKSSADIDAKLDFCDMILDETNLIESELLLHSSRLDLDSIGHISSSIVFHDIKRDIMDKSHFEGFGSAQIGKGEVFLILFSDRAYKGRTGDLSIGSIELELKGKGGVPRGLKGYNAPIGFDATYEFKKELNMTINTRKMSFKQWNNFNKEAKFRGVIKQSLVKQFTKFFEYIYTDHEILKPILDKYIYKMFDENGMHKDSIVYLTALQIEYYMKIENIDCIMFINPDSYKSILICNAEEFIKLKDNFKITPLLWQGKESRQSVNTITYIG